MTDKPADFTHERFRRLDAKLDRILDHIVTLDERLSKIAHDVHSINGHLLRIDDRMSRIERRQDRVDERLELRD